MLRSLKWVVVAIVLIWLPASHALQIPPELRKKLLGELEGKSKAQSLGSETIDNSIIEAEYLIGGGDVFDIDIPNLPSKTYPSTVGSDGNLYVEELGLIEIGPISLEEGRKKIVATLQTRLKKDFPVRVALKKVKTVHMSITGHVQSSGTQAVPGNFRLLDAIKMANGGHMPDMASTDLRNVRLLRHGKWLRCDILKFLSRQDLAANPYVYPGDQVVVERTHLTLYLTGQVLPPTLGAIPYVEGETLEELSRVLNFAPSSADSTHLILKRSQEPQSKTVSSAEASSVQLKPYDLILVPGTQDMSMTDTITVFGNVQRPGVYPIRSGETQPTDLIASAGGLTHNADPEQMLIVRQAKINSLFEQKKTSDPLGMMNGGSRYAIQSSSGLVRPEIRSAIGDLSLTSDFALIQFEKGKEVTLLNGDILVIPQRDPYVYLSGSINRPGPVIYRQGADFDDYVREAGGYNNRADKANRITITSFQGLSLTKAPDDIRPGDILVIPASIEYKRLTAVYLPVIQTLAAVVTTALTAFILLKPSN
jgi:protein involved in polysaccharide export with SLBB domain